MPDYPYNEGVANLTESLTYTEVEGAQTDLDITVFALSTCAFCRRGMEFLSEHGLGYRYVHVDQLDVERKRQLKQELKDRFDVVPVFPILVINNERAYSGFTKLIWSRALGVS
jgi:glutaredoxin